VGVTLRFWLAAERRVFAAGLDKLGFPVAADGVAADVPASADIVGRAFLVGLRLSCEDLGACDRL